MSVAVAQVKQIITIQGVDNASATVAKAQASLKGLETGADHVAEKAGDMERGFRGVKDIIGQVGGPALQDLTDKFGGVEAIIKGFGPGLGPVAVGIAAIGAGVAYWYQQQEKARKAAIDTKIEAIKLAKEDYAASAARLGVSAELLGQSQKAITVEEAIATGKQHNADLDAARIGLLEAQRDKQDEKTGALEREIVQLQSALLLDQARLDKAKDLANSKKLDEVDALRAKTQEAVNQNAINNLLDEHQRINATVADIAKKRYVLAFQERSILADIKAGFGDRLDNEKVLAEIVQKRIDLDAKDRQAAQQAEALLNQRKAKEKAAHDAALARRKKLKDANAAFAADEVKDEEAAYQASKEVNNRAVLAAEAAAAKTVTLAKSAEEAKLAASKATTAEQSALLREQGDVDAAVLLDRQQALAEYAAEVKKINGEIDEAEKALDLTEEQRASLEVARQERTLTAKTATAAAVKRLEDEAAARLHDNVAQIADAVRGPAELLGRLDAGNKGLSAGLTMAASGVGKVAKSWKGLKASAPDAIAASGEVAAAFVDDEKTKAGILAVSETAAAIALAFTPGRQAEAAAHAASAALYAGIAGGIIGSSGASATTGAVGGSPGGFSSGAPEGGIATQQASSGASVVINFNQPLITKQEVGKALSGALRSIGSTGFAKAKGI